MFIVIFIITILILVVIHELGHFFAAKKFNIKVLEFGFGIPPKVFGKKIGETIVSLNWLPFGGFVRLLGEDETERQVLDDEQSSSEWKKRSFAAQTVLKRSIVVVAGVVMNLLLAIIIFYIVLAAQGFKVQIPLLSDHKFSGVQQNNEKLVLIGTVAKGSPADVSGLKSGERVAAINGENINEAQELIDKTKAAGDKEIILTLSNPQKNDFRDITLKPRINPPEGQGPIGVSLGTFEIANIEYQNLSQRIFSGPFHAYNIAAYSLKILSKTIALSVAKHDITPVTQSVAGPIGITTFVKDILSVQNPLIPYLDFVAMLSLNLALVNILPFPGLDGGRFFFLIIEAVTRRRVHQKFEKYVHTVGLVFLLSLIFLVTISDIKKLF